MDALPDEVHEIGKLIAKRYYEALKWSRSDVEYWAHLTYAFENVVLSSGFLAACDRCLQYECQYLTNHPEARELANNLQSNFNDLKEALWLARFFLMRNKFHKRLMKAVSDLHCLLLRFHLSHRAGLAMRDSPDSNSNG
ncbi:uncharacterized protein BP01DRAFT_384769 [Aspergillus saccharolyticus JOP 1030-1]|uniref:Uncharacterized protein n=1 Tax=Aspergillus saccharolyticus JOP 1030-1 TaxID=1450539 RepID=A0A318Z7D8_9EURO|nr:hypothetical protein BP01DRAFT_384769 [Aspergillus saccharolyticus JOP 1030-1]PYH43076.1 hypothetical protein BP01DRAFT_384769 [Aspergillus saccharolyticus JOP 1030-1]